MKYIDLGLPSGNLWAECNIGATSKEKYGKCLYYDTKYGEIPTREDFEELITHCDWVWTTLNKVNGYKVNGLNGNYIFLPAVGCGWGLDRLLEGERAMYWCSTDGMKDGYGDYVSYNLTFDKNTRKVKLCDCYSKYAVRLIKTIK